MFGSFLFEGKKCKKTDTWQSGGAGAPKNNVMQQVVMSAVVPHL